MRNSNFILIYWRKEQKEFSKNFEILRKYTDKNAVHDLRVAIKKMRSCLKLCFFITGKKDWKSLFGETKKLFGVLGKQRDLEVCLELIESFEKGTGSIFSHFKTNLQSQLDHSQTSTHQALKKYPKNELTKIALVLRRDITMLSFDQILKKTIEIINIHLRQVKRYFNQPHQIRKMLKDVYYWIKMLPEGSVPKSSFEKKLNELLDDFGNWQNDEMLLIKIKHYRKDYIPAVLPKYEMFKKIEKKITLRKEKSSTRMLHKTRILSKETLVGL